MAVDVDRRTILCGLAYGAFRLGRIVAFGDLLSAPAFANDQKVPLAKVVIFVDKTLCSGCRTCEMACANFNAAGRNSSSLARIFIEKEYLKGSYQPKVCYQCSDPPCLKACPSGALQIDRSKGTLARIIDENICIGCQECVKACQQYFRPSRSMFDPEKGKAFKCHLCFGDPQCVKFCPSGALRVVRSEKGFLVGYPVIKGD
ncbi:MAG: 4Fe-4S dicluster domain-containing protein [Desulfomonilaceae bacterium]